MRRQLFFLLLTACVLAGALFAAPVAYYVPQHSYQPFNGFDPQSLSWGDYDNDGDDDLAVGGSSPTNFFIEIYRNDGGFLLSGPIQSIDNFMYGISDWADYDNDGDVDLYVSGFSNVLSQYKAYVFRNDGANMFTLVDIGVEGMAYGILKAADYNNDGYADFLLSGSNSSGYSTKIYRNNQDGTFTQVMPLLDYSTYVDADWGDFDSDGDPDLAIIGVRSSGGYTSRVYRNDGSDVFTDVVATLVNVQKGAVRWADVTGDGDLDLFITGRDPSSNEQAVLYAGDGLGGFTAITNPAFAGEDYDAALFKDHDGDGDLDLLLLGQYLVIGQAQLFLNDGTGVYTQDDQAIDCAESYTKAAWTDTDSDGDPDIWMVGNHITKVYENVSGEYTDLTGGYVSLQEAAGEWADFDNDGVLDFVVTGVHNEESVMKVFANDGSGNFSQAGGDYDGAFEGDLVVFDCDNDGDMDILLNGMLPSMAKVTYLYKNEGGFVFTKTDPGLKDTYRSNFDIGDYDNDGDLDVLLAGGVSYDMVLKIWVNDGTGHFSEVSPAVPNVYEGQARWADYDGDGDVDLAYYGYYSSAASGIYRNDGEGVFTLLSGTQSPSSSSAVLCWMDYDRDGDSDLILINNAKEVVFRNDGGDVFTESDGPIPAINIWANDLTTGDYNNDGDVDYLISGYIVGRSVTVLYDNNGSGMFSAIAADQHNILPIPDGHMRWGDCDGDGDLDLLQTGGMTTTVYINNMDPGNTVASAPANPNVTMDQYTATFTWEAGSDSETPADLLTYNAAADGAADDQLISGEADSETGDRRRSGDGNAGHRLMRILEFPEDQVATQAVFRVQTVDGSGAGSPFTTLDFVTPGVPGAVTLDTPAHEATGVALSPDLSWEAATGATSYDVEVDDDSDFSSPAYSATETGTTSSVTVSLSEYTVYYWRVRGSNSYGDGAWSATFSFLTDVRPITAPSGLTAENNGSKEVLFSWTDNSDNEDKFEVVYSTNGINYDYLGSTTGADITTLEIGDLTPGSYTFKVRAVNSLNASDYSNTASLDVYGISSYLIPNDVIWGHAKVYALAAGVSMDPADAEITIDGGATIYAMESTGDAARWESGTSFNDVMFSNGTHTVAVSYDGVLYDTLSLGVGDLYDGASMSYAGLIFTAEERSRLLLTGPALFETPPVKGAFLFQAAFDRGEGAMSIVNPYGQEGALLKKEGGEWILKDYSREHLFFGTSGLYALVKDDTMTFIPQVKTSVLKQNFPNPFNPETDIPYEVKEPGMVTLDVRDARGRLVITLVNEEKPSGFHTVHWNGRDSRGNECPSGVYYAVMMIDGERFTKKMVLLK